MNNSTFQASSFMITVTGESKENTKWVIKDLLPQKEILTITGACRTGKTNLAVDLVESVLNGKSFLGNKTTKGNVIYVNNDDSLSKISCSFENVSNHEHLVISTTLDIEKLQVILEEKLPKLLVVDTSHISLEKIENFKQLTQQYDTALVLVCRTTENVFNTYTQIETK